MVLSSGREGHHREVLEELKKEQSDHRKLAECLGLPLDKVWTYDGVSGQNHSLFNIIHFGPVSFELC